MRKVYEATVGRPQRWESLGNLGAVKADGAGIAYPHRHSAQLLIAQNSAPNFRVSPGSDEE